MSSLHSRSSLDDGAVTYEKKQPRSSLEVCRYSWQQSSAVSSLGTASASSGDDDKDIEDKGVVVEVGAFYRCC